MTFNKISKPIEIIKIKQEVKEEEIIIPKTKDFNLKDPKYKKKDIKKSGRNHIKAKNMNEIIDIKLSKIE
jgi:hypothetical protein